MTTVVNAVGRRFALLLVLCITVLAWLPAKNGWGAGAFPFAAEWPRTDFFRRAVDLKEIESGGPPKDGIPSIDRPQFIPARDASNWLDAREPVIALEVGGDARAYPLQVLIYHEIVNDVVGGIPVVVTFCPLCNASMVFDRRVGNRVLDFGTTGKLRKSDLVMYDRQTESWWQQFTGKGIVGSLSGTELTQLLANIITYADFTAAHPSGKILSRATGFDRPYGRNPYRGYDRVGNSPFLFHDPVDPRLPAMERVIGLRVKGKYRLYPFSIFKSGPVINDEVSHNPVVIFSQEGMLSPLDAESVRESRAIPSATAFERRLSGDVLNFEVRDGAIYDTQTNSRWNLLGKAITGKLKGKRLQAVEGGVHFAFAWLAFVPDAEIFSLQRK